MVSAEDWRRATMQAEYAVYRKMTLVKSKKTMILPGTLSASSVVPARITVIQSLRKHNIS
jgi:hypothetical protein